MKDTPKIGTVGEEKFVVGEQDLIDFAHDGMPRILCTPRLIWFLEHAARNAMLPFLETGEKYGRSGRQCGAYRSNSLRRRRRLSCASDLR